MMSELKVGYRPLIMLKVCRLLVDTLGLFVQAATNIIFRYALGSFAIAGVLESECSQGQEGCCRGVRLPLTIGEGGDGT